MASILQQSSTDTKPPHAGRAYRIPETIKEYTTTLNLLSGIPGAATTLISVELCCKIDAMFKRQEIWLYNRLPDFLRPVRQGRL